MKQKSRLKPKQKKNFTPTWNYEICDCGHERKMHYGFNSYCLYSRLGVWRCLCGYFTQTQKKN